MGSCNISPSVFKQHEGAYGATLFIKYPTRRYMDELLTLNCAPDLLALNCFPNSKEVTESFAAYSAVRNLLKPKGPCDFGDPSTLLVDVCCGSTPRTAITFAYRSRWKCIAIDPNLKGDWRGVERLECRPVRMEDSPIKHDGLVVVTAVHPHISRATIAQYIDAPNILLVDMECCLPLIDAETNLLRKYEDMGIWSPKRTVCVSWLKGGVAS